MNTLQNQRAGGEPGCNFPAGPPWRLRHALFTPEQKNGTALP